MGLSTFCDQKNEPQVVLSCEDDICSVSRGEEGQLVINKDCPFKNQNLKLNIFRSDPICKNLLISDDAGDVTIQTFAVENMLRSPH